MAMWAALVDPSFPRRRESTLANQARARLIYQCAASSNWQVRLASPAMQPAVYLLASRRHGTLYTGVTSNLVQRIWQHRSHIMQGFTQRYEVTRLVWYEMHVTMESAIVREKQIKKWNRAWKLALIERMNPQWADLWEEVLGMRGTGFPPSRE